MVCRLKIFKAILVFIIFLILFISIAEAVKGDKRIIKTFTLENGLDVFLVSDPDVHRSAAALAVGVGHLYDPKEKQGLAHYLEHMLFLGTQKYPEVGSYKKYLDEHSGASNAYTSEIQPIIFFRFHMTVSMKLLTGSAIFLRHLFLINNMLPGK